MKKNILISLAISAILVGGTLHLVSDRPSSVGENMVTSSSQNIEVRDGIQYVTVVAKGGYSPRLSEIKEGIPTKLIVQTNGTYDCSAALVVRSAGFQKILQPTGEETIDLGVPKAGDEIQGVCSMGMYNFKIKVAS